MEKYVITEEDMNRFNLFNNVKEKKLKLVQAAFVLNISYRHTKRLFKAFQEKGMPGLVKKYKRIRKKKKVTDLLIQKIVKYYQAYYYDFNLLHFKDKLHDVHQISLSYETLRQIMLQNKLHLVKKRKKVFRRRRRMPLAGLLIQMDSSQHRWLASVHKKWYLIALIDDATNEVPVAFFVPSDTSYANMKGIRLFIEKKGLFEALYVDQASHFKTTRKDELHQEYKNEQDYTNIEKALAELGIKLIFANSAQAKGRVERLFRFFQDRLIKEMRLNNIKNYQSANHFLQTEFLPWYNKKYTHKVESVYKGLPKDKDLDLIFTLRYYRKVKKDNTISCNGQIIQLPPNRLTLSYTRATVEIRITENKVMYILYKDQLVLKTKLAKPIKETEVEKCERYLSKRIIA